MPNMNRFQVIHDHKPAASYKYRYAKRIVPTEAQMIKDYKEMNCTHKFSQTNEDCVIKCVKCGRVETKPEDKV